MQSRDYWSRKRPILNQVKNDKGKDLISFASIVTPKQQTLKRVFHRKIKLKLKLKTKNTLKLLEKANNYI